MGRKPTIDREAVLDAAEGVVSKRGAAGLTIDAVAKAAGITKGGVQSCFGNKESMIEAMIKRWDVYYQKQLAELSGHTASPDDKLKAHVVTTSQDDENNVSRSAVLLSALCSLRIILARYANGMRSGSVNSHSGKATKTIPDASLFSRRKVCFS